MICDDWANVVSLSYNYYSRSTLTADFRALLTPFFRCSIVRPTMIVCDNLSCLPSTKRSPPPYDPGDISTASKHNQHLPCWVGPSSHEIWARSESTTSPIAWCLVLNQDCRARHLHYTLVPSFTTIPCRLSFSFLYHPQRPRIKYHSRLYTLVFPVSVASPNSDTPSFFPSITLFITL
jgi:hypothetical protein